ncbi:hypothetical protein IFM89_030538 [Coptis chinensis]|uniref:Alpha/beta-Hydrolases superfamily protein n=1 Tax=Coptis chinensis TaxID=261450 RepID=A0A835LPI1_9MAGN|nr:hypothetical protein IFM89_030538 [Coptis chinensis]
MNSRVSKSGDRSKRVVVRSDGMSNNGLVPQLFTSVPTLNDAASYLAQTTSYLTHCFVDSTEEALLGDSSMNAQELRTFSVGQTNESLLTDHQSSLRRCSMVSEPSDTTIAAPSVHDAGMNSSSGDITRDPDEPVGSSHNVQNGLSIFQGHGVHTLPNSMVYLLVPGLFSNHGPLYFVNTKMCFSKMGLACHIAKIHSEASIEKNAREIKEYIEEIYWGSSKRVLLLGHSKGGVDAAAALSMYWPDLRDKVAGLVLAQSPYGGSPIASDILREGQLGDYFQLRKLTEILICKVIKDLTYEKRKEFLRKHQLPKELPVVSLNTEAGLAPGVLATFSHVAHAELPLVAPLAAGQSAKLPVVMPLAAAMAACAQLLQVRYGEKSDGLVTCRDAEVPGSVVVRPKRKLDHAWMVYSSMNDDPSEADASQVCEALLTLLVEIGQKRRAEVSMKYE